MHDNRPLMPLSGIRPTMPQRERALTTHKVTFVAEVLMDAVVETDYGQFDIVYSDEGGFDGEAERYFAGQVNGLVGAADPHGIYLVLGRRSGGSQVRIELGDAPASDPEAWEDVVEVSTHIPEGSSVRWATWAGEESGEFSSLHPGDYRVRVSARGRDAGADGEFEESVVDFYLIEFWPAQLAEDRVVRTTSQDAAYWHGSLGSTALISSSEPRPLHPFKRSPAMLTSRRSPTMPMTALAGISDDVGQI